MELPSKYMLTVAKSLLGFGSGEPLPYQKSRGRDRLQEVALQDFLQDGKELKVLSTSSSMSKREGDSQPKTTCSKAKSEEDVRQENEQWELLHGPDSPDADEEGLEMLLGQPSLPPWHAVAAFCTCYAAQLLSSSPSKAAASVAGAAATAAAGSTGLQELVDLWRSGVWPCLVLDALLPGTLDERAINIAEPTPEPSDRVEASLPSTPFHHSTQGNSQRPQQQQQQQQQQWARLSLEEQCENWELCVSSARAFGCCNVTGVTAVDIAEGKVEVLLQCVMDILKAATLQVLSLHRPSGLTALQKPQENELDFSLQGPESLVHRWTHHHLAQAAQWRSSPQGLPTYGYQERVQSEGKGTYGDGDAVVSVSKDDRGGHGAGVGRGARKDNGGGAREESGKGAGDTGQAGCVAGEEDGLGHKKRRVAEVGVVEVAAVLQELLAWRQHQREYRQQQQQQQQQQELLQRAGKQQGEEHAQGTLPHMGQEQEREAHWGKQKQAEGQQQEELPGSPQLEGQEHDGAAQGPPLPTDTAATYATPYAAAHAAAHALLRAPPHKACVAAAHALAHAVQALELGVPMEPAWAQVVPPQLLQIVLAAAMRVCPALIDPTQLPEPDSSFHSEGVCSSGSSTPKSSSSDRSSGTQAVRGDTRDSLCSPASAANSGEEKEEAGRLKRVAEQKREAGRVVGPESGQGSEKQGPGFSVRLRHVESRSGRIEDGGASSNISDQSVLLQKSRDLKACPTPPHRHRSSPPQQHTTQRMYQLTDDEGAFDKNEERLLRAWLNQLVGPKLGCHLQTLFDPVMLTGYPLLLGCEAIQPGCVQWRQAFVPPFSARSRVPFKIMCTENGNQVCAICTRLWKLPIVNIGGVDVAEGHRSALLSLAWQMMRHHMSCLLEQACSLPSPLPVNSCPPSTLTPQHPSPITHTSPSSSKSSKGSTTLPRTEGSSSAPLSALPLPNTPSAAAQAHGARTILTLHPPDSNAPASLGSNPPHSGDNVHGAAQNLAGGQGGSVSDPAPHQGPQVQEANAQERCRSRSGSPSGCAPRGGGDGQGGGHGEGFSSDGGGGGQGDGVSSNCRGQEHGRHDEHHSSSRSTTHGKSPQGPDKDPPTTADSHADCDNDPHHHTRHSTASQRELQPGLLQGHNSMGSPKSSTRQLPHSPDQLSHNRSQGHGSATTRWRESSKAGPPHKGGFSHAATPVHPGSAAHIAAAAPCNSNAAHYITPAYKGALSRTGSVSASVAAQERRALQASASQRQKQQIEDDVLRWANLRLAESCNLAMKGTSSAVQAPLTGLADPRLAEGQVLLQLLDAMSPGCVRSCHVLPGHTKADKESNAKYAVSVARKVGCFVFLSAEDVVSGKPALMLMLLVALMARDRTLQAAKERTLLAEEGTGMADEAAGTC